MEFYRKKNKLIKSLDHFSISDEIYNDSIYKDVNAIKEFKIFKDYFRQSKVQILILFSKTLRKIKIKINDISSIILCVKNMRQDYD